MEASATQEDALHAALHRIIEDRESYSPAGLALEVARAIDTAYPDLQGVLSAVVDGVLCREERVMSTLDGWVQDRAAREFESA